MVIAFIICGCMWVISSYGWTGAVLSQFKAVIQRVHVVVQSSAKFTVFICVAYFMVAKGDGASEGDLLAYNELLREHAGDDWCMLHADVASRMSEMWSQTMVMPAVHTMAELVLIAEADGCDAEHALVIDTGARRSVIRDPTCFDRLTCRPAPFKVRGVLGSTGQPDFMGNATVYMPVSKTELGQQTHVEAVTLVDAVCIPACPHDIVAVGPLLWGGASMWLAPGKGSSWLRLNSGSYTKLFNRAIIFASSCAPGTVSTVAIAGDASRRSTHRRCRPGLRVGDVRFICVQGSQAILLVLQRGGTTYLAVALATSLTRLTLLRVTCSSTPPFPHCIQMCATGSSTPASSHHLAGSSTHVGLHSQMHGSRCYGRWSTSAWACLG